MNVVHVIPSLDPSQGGPVIALLGLVKAQAKLGQTVQVVVGSHSTSATIAREMEEFGVRVTLTPPQSGRVFESLHVTVAVRRRLPGADVVHIHGLWQFAQTAGAFEARRLGIPYIIRPCGMLDSWSLSQNRILKQLHLAVVTRQLLNGATMLHVTTEREMSEIAGLELRPPMIVVPNGVDDKAFDDAEYEASPELAALKKSHRILLFLGRVHSKKGLDVLVPAMRMVQTDRAILVIIGPREDVHFHAVRQLVQQLDIEDRVRFLDPLYGTERFAAYSAAEIFLLPSKQENFGVTVAEAMARGIPVIVSPEVALSDAVGAAHAGLVVSRNSQLLAHAIDSLLANKQLRLQMGKNGQRAAEEQFRWSNIARRWRDLYASAAKSPSSSC